MSDANATQVAGDHYRSEYQHWDFVIDSQMPYVLGCATKYLTRWRKKNGIQDLKKSIHYIEKAQERIDHLTTMWCNVKMVQDFLTANNITGLEALAFSQVCELDFDGAIRTILEIISKEEAGQ